MPRNKTEPEALTIGQVAARWSVSPVRIRGLVESGKLRGAFRIPSAGRYGATVKIPIAAVVQAEREWAVACSEVTARAPRQRDPRVVLKHFQELNELPFVDSTGGPNGYSAGFEQHDDVT